MKTLASFDHVYFSYSDVEVLQDVSFSLSEGDFLGIVGPNGAGKTTLLKLLLGLLKPQKGKVNILTKKIAYVNQLSPTEDMSFLASVDEIMALTFPNLFLKDEQKKRIEQTSKLLGIEGLRKKKIDELSGGERQKVNLALALLKKSELIVLDEPTAGLDAESQEKLKEILHMINQEGTTLVVVSHSRSHLQFAKRILSIDGKKVTEESHVSV